MTSKKTKMEPQQPTFLPPTLLSIAYPQTPRSVEPPRRSLKNEVKQLSEYLCFNPFCTSPYSRRFDESHPHRNVEACSNWMINVLQLGNLVEGRTADMDTNNVSSIQFRLGRRRFKDALGALVQTENVDWDKYLLSLKQQYLQRVTKQLDKALLQTKQKIDSLKSLQLLTSLSNLYQSMSGPQTKNEVEIRKQMEYIIEEYLIGLCDKEIKINCLKGTELELPGLVAISELKGKIWMEREFINKPEIVNEEDHEEFKKFVLDDSPSSFNKLQQVASMCGKKCDQFVIKARSVGLKCPFCEHVQRTKLAGALAESQLKMMKKELAFEALSHSFNCHYSFIYSKYELKRKKPSSISSPKNPKSPQISLDRVMQDLKRGGYRRLHIIDRESGIANPSLKSEPGTYTLQILSRNNKLMARTRYLLTPDRKCTEFMINYVLVYACLVERLISIENASVQSNVRDINRVQGLKQILFTTEEEAFTKKIKQNQNESNGNLAIDVVPYIYSSVDNNEAEEGQEEGMDQNLVKFQHRPQQEEEQSQEQEVENQADKQKDKVKVQDSHRTDK